MYGEVPPVGVAVICPSELPQLGSLVLDTTTTSVAEQPVVERNGYAMYPNPTSSRVTLQRQRGPIPQSTTVSVFSLLGELVQAPGSRVNDGAFSFNMEALSPGTYLVVIESPELAPEVLKVTRQ